MGCMEIQISKNAVSKDPMGFTDAPVGAALPFRYTPEFIRLPKSPALCPHCGLTRSKMNELVLPCAANNFRPPVKSISLRKRGQTKAVRLVVYDSLMAYLRSFLQEGSVMVFLFLFAALASQSMGNTAILGVSLQTSAATSAAGNLPLVKTTASQIVHETKEGTDQ